MGKMNIWTAAFLGIVSLSRIGNGLFSSLSGPTLLYLADNVGASVAQVSYVFTGRSLGFFVGSALCGLIIRKFDNYKPLVTVGACVILSGILMTITPWLTNLALLVTMTTITGLLFGYLDAGIQSIYLKLWGERDSRPYLQSFHFAFGVGALLAPIFAAPFLAMAGAQDEQESCPASGYQARTIDNATTAPPPASGLNPVAWTYVISGSFTLVIGIAMLALALIRIESKIRSSAARVEVEAEKAEEPLRAVVWLFLPIVCFYFAFVSLEIVYQSFIYSVALCTAEIAFSVEDAALLNTLFWIGFMLGRCSGIFYASYFPPYSLILYDLVGTTISIIVLAIFGRNIPIIFWVCTLYFGFCVSHFYSAGISWTSQLTNVSSTYIFIFALGNTVGSMSMPLVAGAIFDLDPFNVVYLLVGLAVINVVFVGWMFHVGKRHKQAKQQPNTNTYTRL